MLSLAQDNLHMVQILQNQVVAPDLEYKSVIDFIKNNPMVIGAARDYTCIIFSDGSTLKRPYGKREWAVGAMAPQFCNIPVGL